MSLKQVLSLGVGFLAGIAFVVACPAPVQLSPSTTRAESAGAAVRQPSGCREWEVSLAVNGLHVPNTRIIEPGWEPFAETDYGISIRRCVSREPEA